MMSPHPPRDWAVEDLSGAELAGSGDVLRSCPICLAILKERGETSIVEPAGRVLKREDESPRTVDVAEGFGESTRRRRG